jgi:hypothetical protein
VTGWAWSTTPVGRVDVAVDGDVRDASVEPRPAGEFSWQRFSAWRRLTAGSHVIAARATDRDGRAQPLGDARNEVHRIRVLAD